MAQASLGHADGRTAPLPAPGKAQELRASAALTSAWVATDVVAVADARRVTLFCAYSVHASATAAQSEIRVMLSAHDGATEGAAPTVALDKWYAPSILDSSATATVLTGTIETGATITVAPEWGVVTARPLAILLGEPSDNASDEYRLAVTIEASWARWLYVAAKELGDTTNLSTLAIDYSLSL